MSGPATVLQALLQSPHFLYRVQLGIADPKRAGAGIVGLSGFELGQGRNSSRLVSLACHGWVKCKRQSGVKSGQPARQNGSHAQAQRIGTYSQGKVQLLPFHTRDFRTVDARE